jgi:hypothetical protein
MGAKSDNSADALLFCFRAEHCKLDHLKCNGPYEDYMSYADKVLRLNSQPVESPYVKLMYPYATSNNILEYSIAVPMQSAIALSQGKTWDEVIKLPNPNTPTVPMTQAEVQDYLRKRPHDQNAGAHYTTVARLHREAIEPKKEDD